MIATLPLFDGSHTSAARGDSGGSTVGTAQRDYDHLVFTIHLDGTSYVPGKASTKTFTTSVYEDDGQSTACVYLSFLVAAVGWRRLLSILYLYAR
jgi:hypothetical protein